MSTSVRDILHILFKRKQLLVAVFTLVAVPLAAGAILRPTVYQSTASLMVTGNRAYMQIGGEGDRATVAEPELRVINTEVENIKSDAFLRKVAAAVDVPVAVKATDEDGARLQRAVSYLRRRLVVSAVPKSALITLAYTDGDPKRAAGVLDVMSNLYLRHHAEIRDHQEAAQFFDQQAALLAAQVDEAERRVRDFQEREGLVSLKEEEQLHIQQVGHLTQQIRETQSSIEEKRELITVLEEQVKNLPERVAQGVEMVQNPMVHFLRRKLAELEIALNELRQQYTDKDRRVIDKRKEIEGIRNRLASLDARVVGRQSISMNRLRRDLEKDLARARAAVQAMTARLDELTEQRAAAQGQLDEVNRKGYRLAALERDAEAKRNALSLYQKRAEEARLAQAMDEAKLVGVTVVQPATVPTKPVPAHRLLRILLALVAGFTVGVSLAFAVEYLYPTFNTAADVERLVALPVLAAIPDLRERY